MFLYFSCRFLFNLKSGHQIYPEPKGALEEIGDKIMISMHFHSIPTRVRNHNCSNSLNDGCGITWHVNAKQSMLIDHCVVFIDAPCCPTISNKVLGTCHHLVAFSIQQKTQKLVSVP